MGLFLLDQCMIRGKLEWLQNSWNGQKKNSFRSMIVGTNKMSHCSVESTVWTEEYAGFIQA
jgi:hypothetical protein